MIGDESRESQMTQEHDPDSENEMEVVRREEQLEVDRVEREVGRVRIRKVIEERPFEDVVARGIEHAEFERVPAHDDDSGELEQLPDGSVSIPVLEEQLVVEKRVVVRERVIVRKRVERASERVHADLRREVMEVDVDPEAQGRVHIEEDPQDQ
jgi:stress response protein YsnF